MKKDKVYLSSFLLGMVTDSGDLDGNVISENSVLNINIEKIKKQLKCLKVKFSKFLRCIQL
jgi:tRNA pseudouridine55 synthase